VRSWPAPNNTVSRLNLRKVAQIGSCGMRKLS
jgi:hypothetical protein